MLITFCVRVTPRRNGDVLYKGRLIGRVRRVNKKGSRPWECCDVLNADTPHPCEAFLQECNTQREGIIRLLMHHGLVEKC